MSLTTQSIIRAYGNTPLHEFVKDYAYKSAISKRDRLFRATAAPYERKYRVMLKKTFSEQLDDILGNLQGRKGIPFHFYKTKQIYDMFDWSKYQITYNEFGQYLLPEIMSDWGNQELEKLEVGISFDVLNPDVQTAINNRSNKFADDTVNTTRDMLHKVINESLNQGDSIAMLEKKIRMLYTDMSKYRAVRIARTEAIWGLNEGAEQSYIQSGVVIEKSWVCAHDERTCPICLYLDKKSVGLGGNYFNQGDSITLSKPVKAKDSQTFTFNYEAVKHPPSHPHCRCTIVPITELFTKP